VIEMAIKLGRTTRPDLESAFVASTAGEPSSVEFCYAWNELCVVLSYRVPIARLAAGAGGDLRRRTSLRVCGTA